MQVCPSCGEENPERFRLCGYCGTPLSPVVTPHEVRKTVTIVFSDLKGSTNLGEALDSESLREVMSRYFDAMRGELEHHGGTIEKFIGDAVMAVFGLPKLHEDDALRAVRAAAGMQRALEELNDELEQHYGVRLVNRTGVNTGEVVAGDPTAGQRLVTGDAVNVAARLEQAAGACQVLLGELTYRLVRDHVEVDGVEPLELKGKSQRVPAYQLVSVRSAAAADERRIRRPGR
jgi:class 3 adenylate cyclase